MRPLKIRFIFSPAEYTLTQRGRGRPEESKAKMVTMYCVCLKKLKSCKHEKAAKLTSKQIHQQVADDLGPDFDSVRSYCKPSRHYIWEAEALVEQICQRQGVCYEDIILGLEEHFPRNRGKKFEGTFKFNLCSYVPRRRHVGLKPLPSPRA